MSDGVAVKGWFQLERALLRDRSLPPIPKLVLQDLLDRTKHPRRAGDAGTTDRAADLGVTRPTLQAAEDWLETNGYLLRLRAAGRRNVYLARYPAAPVGHADRETFEQEFAALCGRVACKPDEHVKPVSMPTTLPTTCKADLQDSNRDSLLSVPEKKEKKIPEPTVRAPRPPAEAAHPDTNRTMDLWAEIRGFPLSGSAYAREAKFAKQMLRRGFEPSQIVACWKWLNSDSWWQNRGGTGLAEVDRRIEGWRGMGEPEAMDDRRAPNGQNPPHWNGRGLRPGVTVQDRAKELYEEAMRLEDA